MKTHSAVMAAALIAIVAIAAGAHHSAAPFDTSTEKTIEGTVKQFDWTNPHTWVWLDVPKAGGGVETWGIEGMSPNYLARRGWSKNTLKVGDKVSAVIRPMKDGSPGGMFVSVKLASGQVMRMTGEPTQ
jgi:hypothetical protein